MLRQSYFCFFYETTWTSTVLGVFGQADVNSLYNLIVLNYYVWSAVFCWSVFLQICHLIPSFPIKLPMVIFNVFCYAVINNTVGINMDCAVLSGNLFLLLAICLSPFRDSSSFYGHFWLYAIYWLQGVPHMLLLCTELIMQTSDMSLVTTHSLFVCWLTNGSSGGSFQLPCVWEILLTAAELPKSVRNEGLATEWRIVISAQTGHVKSVATSECDGINEGKQ